VPLFAAKGWDPKSLQFTYENQKKYDFEAKKWIREIKYPLTAKPSADEAFLLFSKSYHVDMDRKTKIIRVSFESLAPEISQQWLNWLVADFNEYVRSIDIKESSKNLEYLSRQIEKTSMSEMQEVFYSLIEEQTKKFMLAEVQEQYAVKTIDSPALASTRSSPRRAVITIAGTLMGAILSSGIVLLLFFRRQSKK